MKQSLLFPDERPLVDRFGLEFFQQAPECAGVYLMRSSADEVLYVGKAKNLRQRLGSYRVANPDRMRPRHLRLLRSVARIELHACDSEDSALAKESALLRNLRPKYNKAGTWPSPPRHVAWRLSPNGFELAVMGIAKAGWFSAGPLGAGAVPVRNLLLRVLWCGIFPEQGLIGMPPGWFQGSRSEILTIPLPIKDTHELKLLPELLAGLWEGGIERLTAWIQKRVPENTCPFESTVRASDLELLKGMAARRNQGTS
jgi:hypothetical protein